MDQVGQNTSLAIGLIEQAVALTNDLDQQIMALVTAATVLIKIRVGRTSAPSVLIELITPTLKDWAERKVEETVQ